MTEEEKMQQIEDFLLEKLNPVERKEFENKLLQDKDLQEDVETYRKAFDEIQVGGRSLLKKELQEFESALPKVALKEETGAKIFKLPVRWLVGIAATLLILLASIFIFNKTTSSTQDLYVAYYEPYPNVIATIDRGNGEEIVDEKREALRAYDQRDYKKSFQLLDGLSQKYPYEIYLRFYAGMSLIELNESSKALVILKPITEKPSDFSEQANWYTALTYLKMQDTQNASIYLTRLLKEEGLYKNKANQLLKDLKD